MIAIHELKYSLGALLLIVAVILGFLPYVKMLDNRFRHPLQQIKLLEATTSAVIISIIYLASTSLLLILLPTEFKRIAATVVLLLPVISGTINTLRQRTYYFQNFFSPRDTVFVIGVLVFSAIILVIASIKVPLPDKLPDGAYVNKEHVSAVRIQFLTGNLPADNVIPYVAQEYLVRSISFSRNNPILPGQQVTNRPILVSLVALPFRLCLRPINSMTDLPTYNYVGTQWPDFRVLVRDEATFSVFLGICVFLNACLLLGAGLLVIKLQRIELRHCLLILFLFTTSPYFIFQTIFTWPKALAGFFIITATFHYLEYRRLLLSGALLGLGYLSHPYAAAYFIVATTLIALKPHFSLKRVSLFVLAFVAILIPWLVWTKIIGLSSNLVKQNFSFSMSFFQFTMARITNLMNTILPAHLMSYGANINSVFLGSSLNLVGSLGAIFSLLILYTNQLVTQNSNFRFFTSNLDEGEKKLIDTLIFYGLSSLLLTFVFSNSAIPIVHGWQPFVTLMIVTGVFLVKKVGRIGENLLLIQIAINITTLSLYLINLLKLKNL